MRLAALALLVVTPAAAGPWGYPESQLAPDEFSLEIVSDDLAVVEYWNAEPPNSIYFPRELTIGDFTVGIEVTTTSGPEMLFVYPPDGWVAVPPALSVLDGEMGRVEIRRGVYHGN